MIFVNPRNNAFGIMETLLEDGAHALRHAKGRRDLKKTDLSNFDCRMVQ